MMRPNHDTDAACDSSLVELVRNAGILGVRTVTIWNVPFGPVFFVVCR